jgi:hypothetical protein
MDHLAMARETLAIAESADSKREAYRRAAEHVAAHREETSESLRTISGKLQLPMTAGSAIKYVQALLKWRDTDYAAETPWLSDERATDRAAVSHSKKVLREQPEAVAPQIAEALGDPKVRRKVVEAMDDRAVEGTFHDSADVNRERTNARFEEQRVPPPDSPAGITGDEGVTERGLGESAMLGWLDDDLIRVSSNAGFLWNHWQKNGLVFGMDDAEALAKLVEAEERIAEVRAALQERVNEQAAV